MRRGRPLTRLLTVIGLLAVGLIFFSPLYVLVATSLKTKAELFLPEPTVIPQNPSLASYENVLFGRNMITLLGNSVIVGLVSTILALIIAMAICYPITRLPTSRRTRAGVMNWALSLRFLAPIAVVIPYFTIVRTLGIYNQLPALILAYTIFNLPLSIWMLKGFLREIPLEIEEAALVDGGSRWQAFRHVLLPMSRIGVLAAGIIVFAFDWAEFQFAFILTATPQAQTFPVGVAGLVTQFEIIWNEMAAAAVIAITIPVIVMFAARRHITTGLTFGVIREK
ncbi:MAG TPA: carbohydrate ABC transporter permease [Candidatus Limnocylindrales bacterium]|nr:carbohydrate ABC transporter permease [Candidatus Limnocylindrales bacterium]